MSNARKLVDVIVPNQNFVVICADEHAAGKMVLNPLVGFGEIEEENGEIHFVPLVVSPNCSGEYGALEEAQDCANFVAVISESENPSAYLEETMEVLESLREADSLAKDGENEK